jgi:hypothetical protein
MSDIYIYICKLNKADDFGYFTHRKNYNDRGRENVAVWGVNFVFGIVPQTVFEFEIRAVHYWHKYIQVSLTVIQNKLFPNAYTITSKNMDTGALRCSRAGNRVQIVRKKGKVGDTTEELAWMWLILSVASINPASEFTAQTAEHVSRDTTSIRAINFTSSGQENDTGHRNTIVPCVYFSP